MSKNFELKAIISAVDKLSPVLKRVRLATRATHKSLRDIGGASRQLTSVLGGIVAPITGILGALGVGGIGASAGYVVKVSAQFEKFQTILETVEGSAEKAKASMGWVQDFATTTPYELEQVTDAYVKLRAYGIDPQAGALKSAGDAAAAMGKSLEQAVEAMADALTGENERLKEFGIKASKAGDMITYTWTENGKTMAAKARASSKAQIQATLEGIWNRRYGGAMDKLSGTWDGLWSNIKDTVARFALQIGDAGLFPFLKDQMKGLLDTLDRMGQDGSLKALATTISNELVVAFKELKAWVMSVDWKAVWSDIKSVAAGIASIVESLGGIKGMAIGFAALLGVQILAPLVAIGAAVGRLSVSLASAAGGAGKLLPLMGKIGAVGGAGWAGWEVGTFLNKNFIEGTRVGDSIGRGVAKTLAAFGNDDAQAAVDAERRYAGSQAKPAPRAIPPGLAHRRSVLATAGQRVEGEVSVRFENAPPGMRVSGGKTNTPGFSVNPDVGYGHTAMNMP